MKKIVSIILALVLMLALGQTVQAADDNQIILYKLDIAKFEADKAAELIADGELPAGGTVTYDGNLPTGAALSGSDVVGTYTTSESAAKVDVTLGELRILENVSFMIEQVTLSDGKTAGSTDPDDYEVTGGYTNTQKTDNVGNITWSGLTDGYYRITEIANDTGTPVGASRFIVALPMVDPVDDSKLTNTVYVYPKNRAVDGPVIEKEKPDLADFNGNILSWTIKAEIPATLKATMGDQKYIITDTMSDGLKYAGNLNVYYLSGGSAVKLTAGTDYTAPAQNGDMTLQITLTASGFNKLGSALPDDIDKDANGRYILYVTYDTAVSLTAEELAAATKPNNEVELNFVNSDGTEYENFDDEDVTEFASLKLLKHDGNNEAKLLAGAKFKIYTALSGAAVDPASSLKDAAGTELVFETDANGSFQYSGLGPGTYYIVETAAPSGYKMLTGYKQVTISEADADGVTVVEVKVANYFDNGLSLPNTGDIGIGVFIALGLVLLASAALVLGLAKRRQRKE